LPVFPSTLKKVAKKLIFGLSLSSFFERLVLCLFIGKSKIKLIIYLAFIHKLSHIPIFKQKNKHFPPIVPIQKISRADALRFGVIFRGFLT